MRIRALAVAATVALALAPALAGAADVPAPAPGAVVPGQLTVGVNLPSEGFQVGAVRGRDVVFARGLEIDLAKALARRLGLGPAHFVQAQFTTLISPGAKPWDLAIAQITVTPRRAQSVDFSVPYMQVDEGVLLSQDLATVPGSIADLQPLTLCALRGTTGASLVGGRIRPAKALFLKDVPTMMLSLQTGKCQAVVYDAPTLGTLKARAPSRFGRFAGVIRTGEQYAVALPTGSALTPDVNTALKALIANGTVAALQKKWVTVNLAGLPVLS